MEDCSNLKCAGDFIWAVATLVMVTVGVYILRPKNKRLRLLLAVIAFISIIIMSVWIVRGANERYKPIPGGGMKFLER